MFGITVFILIPAYVFSIIEEWSYLDAMYFSVISLTKVGFGDYVPRTHPPDSYATYRHTPNDCLKALVNIKPNSGKERGFQCTGNLLVVKTGTSIKPNVGTDGITIKCRKVFTVIFERVVRNRFFLNQTST